MSFSLEQHINCQLHGAISNKQWNTQTCKLHIRKIVLKIILFLSCIHLNHWKSHHSTLWIFPWAGLNTCNMLQLLNRSLCTVTPSLCWKHVWCQWLQYLYHTDRRQCLSNNFHLYTWHKWNENWLRKASHAIDKAGEHVRSTITPFRHNKKRIVSVIVISSRVM